MAIVRLPHLGLLALRRREGVTGPVNRPHASVT
jgi:hypothetical protein